MFRTLDLVAVEVPEGSALRRDSVLKDAAQPPGFQDRYDFRTLVYSATRQARGGGAVLVCPPLLNLARPFLDGLGVAVRRVRRYRRHWEVEVEAPRGDAIEAMFEGEPYAIPVAAPDPAFAGQVVLQTLSKDNDLEWIADWARHYAATQGITHVLFFDNNSTTYESEQVTEALARVPGLQGATVVRCRARYGPMGLVRPSGAALFLQLGLLNTSRHRYAGRARAVLYCDVDEMLFSPPGETLVGAALRHPLGYANAKAHWRYARVPEGRKPGYGDHLWRREPDMLSMEKWALRPVFRPADGGTQRP